MNTRRKVAAVVAAIVLAFTASTACSNVDPHKCGPDDVDGDNDGRCNE